MATYDVIMLAVLLAATLFGAWKGIAWQVASIASIVVSYFVAYHLRTPVASMISAAPPWNMFLAMLVLFIATSAIIWIAFHLLKDFIDRVRLKEFDHQAGALAGAAKGVLLCVVITLFSLTLLKDQQRQQVVDSHSGYYIALLLDRSHVVIPDDIHDVLEPYIHSLDERLENPTAHSHDEEHVGATHEEPDLSSNPSETSPGLLDTIEDRIGEVIGDQLEDEIERRAETFSDDIETAGEELSNPLR